VRGKRNAPLRSIRAALETNSIATMASRAVPSTSVTPASSGAAPAVTAGLSPDDGVHARYGNPFMSVLSQIDLAETGQRRVRHPRGVGPHRLGWSPGTAGAAPEEPVTDCGRGRHVKHRRNRVGLGGQPG